MKIRSHTLAMALAVTGFTISPTVAFAEEQTRTAGVTYDDLDLSTEEGRQELDRRIDHAARQVCELDRRDLGTRSISREARACYEEAKRNFEERFAGLIRENR